MRNPLECLTADEITESLKICRKTLATWIKLDLFPPPLKIGGTLRWPVATLEEWFKHDGPGTIKRVNDAQLAAKVAEAKGRKASFVVEGCLAPIPAPQEGEEIATAEDVLAEDVLATPN
ncbi:MAG: helix-turn-helix transcriptional regulator [Thermoguttaceae bacterium]|jgi:predicted DNA-binding transcriptional regulator AlpA